MARIDHIYVGKDEMAQILGVSTITLDGWIRSGCPVHQQGGKGLKYQFSTADVINWIREQERNKGRTVGTTAAPVSDAKNRIAEANAKMRELELDQHEGRLVDAQGALDAIEEQHIKVRTHLLGIAGRLAPRLAALHSAPECERVVADEVHEALKNLSAQAAIS